MTTSTRAADPSAKSAKLNFELCYEISKLQNGKRQPFYRMTKDGFMFLVMGFTGREAARMKEAFIAAFNRMAEFIRTRVGELKLTDVG